jgi:hypothetical protein
MKSGWRAIKSRRRRPAGGFMLVDASTNACVHGSWSNLTAQDVIEIATRALSSK